MSGEAPDLREQEDCPGAEFCDGRCDQHQPMTPDAAGIEAALAAGLAAHHLSSGGRNLGAYRTEWTCECGATFITDGHVGPTLREANIAHQAAALLPVVTQAQAEAWDKCAADPGEQWRVNPYRARADESGA